MDKIIYELYYRLEQDCFHSCYKCVVNKETEKMFYGDVLYENGVSYNARFSINKSRLEQIHRIVTKDGLSYRIQLEADSVEDAKIKACKIICDHITDFVEIFKKNYNN